MSSLGSTRALFGSIALSLAGISSFPIQAQVEILHLRPESTTSCEDVLRVASALSNTHGKIMVGSLNDLDLLIERMRQRGGVQDESKSDLLRTLEAYVDFLSTYQGSSSGVHHLKNAMTLDPSFSKRKLLVCFMGENCSSDLSSFHLGSELPDDVVLKNFFGKIDAAGASEKEVSLLKESNQEGVHILRLSQQASASTVMHELAHFANAFLLGKWIEANRHLPEREQDHYFKTYTRENDRGLELDTGFLSLFEEAAAEASVVETQLIMEQQGRLNIPRPDFERAQSRGYFQHALESYGDGAKHVAEMERINADNYFLWGRGVLQRMRSTIEKANTGKE